MNRILIPPVLALLALLLLVRSAPSSSVTATQNLPNYKPGELIVKFKNRSMAKKSHAALKSRVMGTLSHLRVDHVRLSSDTTVAEAMKSYAHDPNVEYAEPNYIFRKAVIPNDPLFGNQWNMLRISAPAAWDISTGSKAPGSKVIAVLDTGTDIGHPDLVANLWTNPGEIPNNGLDDDANGIVDDYHGVNFNGSLMPSGNVMDDDARDAHGTHIAGILGASGNNSIGVAGVNWNTRIMSVKFAHGDDAENVLSDVLKGVEYALANGARIINFSYEFAEEPGISSEIKSLRDAVALADSAGALFVGAAGNTGQNLENTNVFPASIRLPNNIAVAATSYNDTLAYYSDFGRSVVHIAAPGGDQGGNGVLSTVRLTDFQGAILLYRQTAGTSMATPHVSGLAALVWNLNPSLSHYQVKARIMNSVDKIDSLNGKIITGGRINAALALTVGDLPAIFDIKPLRAMPGETITITGVNFGASTGAITIGGIPVTSSSWSPVSLSATVPVGAQSGEVLVNGLGSGFYLAVPPEPSAALTATPATGIAPRDITFSLALSGTDVVISKYEWDFGDGMFSEVAGISTMVTRNIPLNGTYTVRARVTDDFGRSSVAQTVVTLSPTASSTDSGGGGGGGGGGCFIATAAYGSSMHPRVLALRHFRDRYLLTNIPGRLFVRMYYAVSPPLADFIARHESLRSCVRVMLTPLVRFAEKIDS